MTTYQKIEKDGKPVLAGCALKALSDENPTGDLPGTPFSEKYATKTELANKLDATKSTFQTTAPTEAATDGGVHIVFLTAEPTTKYDGYIYLIAE